MRNTQRRSSDYEGCRNREERNETVLNNYFFCASSRCNTECEITNIPLNSSILNHLDALLQVGITQNSHHKMHFSISFKWAGRCYSYLKFTDAANRPSEGEKIKEKENGWGKFWSSDILMNRLPAATVDHRHPIRTNRMIDATETPAQYSKSFKTVRRFGWQLVDKGTSKYNTFL